MTIAVLLILVIFAACVGLFGWGLFSVYRAKNLYFVKSKLIGPGLNQELPPTEYFAADIKAVNRILRKNEAVFKRLNLHCRLEQIIDIEVK
jgi:hypothetical protein